MSLYCPMQNAGQVTNRKTHPVLPRSIFSNEILDEFHFRWLKIKNYRDRNESLNSYLDSVMPNHLKWNYSKIKINLPALVRLRGFFSLVTRFSLILFVKWGAFETFEFSSLAFILDGTSVGLALWFSVEPKTSSGSNALNALFAPFVCV